MNAKERTHGKGWQIKPPHRWLYKIMASFMALAALASFTSMIAILVKDGTACDFVFHLYMLFLDTTALALTLAITPAKDKP
jgi:hypothetical protein